MTRKYELLEGEAHVGDGMIMTQREWAADVLQHVADNARIGSYPQATRAFDLGRALGRALTNSSEGEDVVALGAEIQRGIEHYQNVKQAS